MAADKEAPPRTADIVLGFVSGAYGVRGWVKLHSYTEPREALLDYRSCFLRRVEEHRAIRIVEGRRQGKTLVAKIDGIDDPDAAAALRGAEVVVPRNALPPLADGRYYWADLEGCAVVTPAGGAFGRVSHLLATGANDVLVVVDDAGERLIPFVMNAVVLEVDVAAGRILVDWEADW